MRRSLTPWLSSQGLLDDPEGYVTNGQLYDLMDPNKDFLPYMFDDFSWSHCKDLEGIDFSTIQLGVEIIDDTDTDDTF